MAPQIGESLREARARRGIELAEAQQATKIRARYLDAMERERWDLLPDPAYVRGFLHTYAEFLGLDAEDLVEQYGRGLEARAAAPSEAEPLADALTEPLMKHAPETPRAGFRFSPSLVVGLAAAAVIGFLVVLGLTGGSQSGRQGSLEKAASSPTSTTTQSTTTTTTAAAPTVVSVRLQPTGTVWVCLVDDRGRYLVNGETLTSGQTRGPFRAKSFKVRLGNGEMRFDLSGKTFQVPPVAQPVGYSITPTGVHKLGSAAQPTCA